MLGPMLSEQEYTAEMDRVAQALVDRNRALAAAQETFADAVIHAYEAGLSIADIRHATGIAHATIRNRLLERGVEIR